MMRNLGGCLLSKLENKRMASSVADLRLRKQTMLPCDFSSLMMRLVLE